MSERCVNYAFERMTDKRVRIPSWRIATFALLLIAFGIAVSDGNDWDAAVVGVFVLVQALVLAAWVYYVRRRDR